MAVGFATAMRLAMWMLTKRETPPTPDQPEPAYKEGSVQWLQSSLNKLTNAGLVVDGVYGEKTREAVSGYQQVHELEVDGWAGPATVASILESLAE